MSYTIIIVVVTILTSLLAFSNDEFRNRSILYPYVMDRASEYYRLLSSGFIHGDYAHLAFNMYALYMFGEYMESIFTDASFHGAFVILYLTAIVISSVPAMIKHRNHSYYMALGASGGVSAIVFSFIYFEPWTGMGIMFIPVRIPAIVFGALYLAYTWYSAKRGSDNIGHDAHLWGSIYGFVFAFFNDPTHGQLFLEAIRHPR